MCLRCGCWVCCQVKNKDQYGRNVAACSISPDLPFQQPEDMGTFLVSNGYAVAYR
jgi:endonuclease YncB( thermonuclease family)